MNDDSTNKLCKTLGDKAVADLRKRLEQANIEFHKGLSLQGTSTTFSVKVNAQNCTTEPGGSEVTVQLNSRHVLDAIINKLISDREQKCRNDAVVDFMKDVASFRSRVMELEEYAAQLDYQ